MWWDELSTDEKDAIFNISNFNKEIFKKITGINVESQLDDLLDELEEARATKKDKFEILSMRAKIKAIVKLMASEVKGTF